MPGIVVLWTMQHLLLSLSDEINNEISTHLLERLESIDIGKFAGSGYSYFSATTSHLSLADEPIELCSKRLSDLDHSFGVEASILVFPVLVTDFNVA